MWRLEKRARVYLALGTTDMRKSIQGLSTIVELELERALFNGDLFVFCNGRRNLVKILYYDRNGFCLWMNYLASYCTPSASSEVFWQSPHLASPF